MENELLEIVEMMNRFSRKYKCEIEVETFESRFIDTKETETIYKLRAIRPEKIELEVVSGRHK